MRAPPMGPKPPAASRTAPRTSMHPPAAAAVRPPGRLTRRNGYSWAKKYTNAGTSMRSQKVSARSSAICETRARRGLGRADQRGEVPGR